MTDAPPATTQASTQASTLASTLAAYDAHAADYAQKTRNLPEIDAARRLVAALPPGARLLDLGCGPGQYAAWFARHGLTVEAIDGAPQMVALARRQPGVTARQALFDDITGPPRYHAIWANFSLLHLPRAALPGTLSRIAGALLPGGLLHLGMKQGTGEKADPLGRHYTYWQADELTALLAQAGLRAIWQARDSGTGLAGNLETYLLIQAMKP